MVDAGLGQLAFYNTNLQSYMEMTDKAADGRKKESHPGVIALEGNPEILDSWICFFLKPEAFSCCVDCCVDKLQNLSQDQVCKTTFFFLW